MIGRSSSGGFEAHPGTQVPSASYSPSHITIESKHTRDSRGPDKADRRSRGVERVNPDICGRT